MAGRVLGSVCLAPTNPAADGYLTTVAEPSPAYAPDGVLHPGLVLQGANPVLIANLVLPAWLHMESDIRYLRALSAALSAGAEVQVRARVREVFERKGHRFVRLDVAWVAERAVVAAVGHTAIWRLAAS